MRESTFSQNVSPVMAHVVMPLMLSSSSSALIECFRVEK